jgi:hypothetical protein
MEKLHYIRRDAQDIVCSSICKETFLTDSSQPNNIVKKRGNGNAEALAFEPGIISQSIKFGRETKRAKPCGENRAKSQLY